MGKKNSKLKQETMDKLLSETYCTRVSSRITQMASLTNRASSRSTNSFSLTATPPSLPRLCSGYSTSTRMDP